MSHTPYALSARNDLFLFEFESSGPNGLIRKRILFTVMESSPFVFLSFGDALENGLLDDLSSAKNGDGEKVLRTVAEAVRIFLENTPDALIYFEGSTTARNRLYRFHLNRNIKLVQMDYEIYCWSQGRWQRFTSHLNPDAFLIARKMPNFKL